MRILIVDDAAPLRAALGHIVASLGHEVAGVAEDAETALSLAGGLRPDVIALDGRLVDDSLALLTGLRAAAPEAGVLLVASLGETALVRAACSSGAAGALLRPFLRSRVAAALSEFEAERVAAGR
jgi:two-component system chemotaxis response regulator CheY